MSFQDKLLDSFIAFEQEIDLDNPIHTYRKNALNRFESEGFPTKKDELWKYTSLKSIIQKDYSLSVKSNPKVKALLQMSFLDMKIMRLLKGQFISIIRK